VFWLDGTFPSCVWQTMGFHMSVLLQFCWLVIFSQIWVASGPLLCLEYRDLQKHQLFMSKLVAVLLWLPWAFIRIQCKSTVKVSSRLGLPWPASLPIDNTQAGMKTYSTSCAPCLQTGHCRTHFTDVRVSF